MPPQHVGPPIVPSSVPLPTLGNVRGTPVKEEKPHWLEHECANMNGHARRLASTNQTEREGGSQVAQEVRQKEKTLEYWPHILLPFRCQYAPQQRSDSSCPVLRHHTTSHSHLQLSPHVYTITHDSALKTCAIMHQYSLQGVPCPTSTKHATHKLMSIIDPSHLNTTLGPPK